MQTINVNGRLGIVRDGRYIDVERASGGAFGPDVQGIFGRWEEFRGWASDLSDHETARIPDSGIGSPVPLPPQVFAIGLNYKAHAAEGGTGLPTTPQVFTKFPASVTGPRTTIRLPQGSVDYEAEMVVVIGRRAENVAESDAWSHVAGLTAGQDISERELQTKPPLPQFSLGKSFAGFAPIGPVLVTPDEFDNPDDLELTCRLNGETMQQARTSDLIFPVARLVSYLSGILPLLPGDVIFTGTPDGIGFVREPKILLRPGDELVTELSGVGTMVHAFAPR